jgi:recombination protein RecR
MSEYPASFERLIFELEKLPGIGPRSAIRLAFYILKKPVEFSTSLAQALVEAKSKIHPCRNCFNLSEGALCTICQSSRRDTSLLLVVEDPSDIVAFERTHEYQGLYHVLGGVLSPLEGKGPQDLTLNALVQRLQNNSQWKEVIVATNPTVEGDSTAFYIQQQLKPFPVKVTRIARGLPSGGDVDYADESTLLKSLEGRQTL